MINTKKLLIIIRIEAGLGDVNYGLRLFENLKERFYTTVLFVNCMKKQITYLNLFKKLIIKNVDVFNIQPEINTIFILNSNFLENEDIERFTKVFDKILNFHYDIKRIFNHVNVINFDEYGKNSEKLRILFRDFFKVYPTGLVKINEILTINHTPLEFKKIYKLNDEEFDISKITKLSKSRFYLSYFANLSLIHKVLTFFYFVKKVVDLSLLNNFTILTNFDFSELVKNKNFEEVNKLLEKEVNNEGFTDNYYKLYYIKQIGDFQLRIDNLNNLEVSLQNKTVSLKSYSMLHKYEYDYLLLKSEDIFGCTGDMSFSEGISTNRLFIYQTLSHKLNFRKILIKLFAKHAHNKNNINLMMFDPCLIDLSNNLENFEDFKNDWKNFVKNYLVKNNFIRWLNSELNK